MITKAEIQAVLDAEDVTWKSGDSWGEAKNGIVARR